MVHQDELAALLARIPRALFRLRIRITGILLERMLPQARDWLFQDDRQEHVKRVVEEPVQRVAGAIPTVTDAIIIIDGRNIEQRVWTFRRHDADQPGWMRGALDPCMFELDRSRVMWDDPNA